MEQLKAFLKRLQDLGIPLLWVTDPIRKVPSVSLTLLIVTLVLTLLATYDIVKADVDQLKEILFSFTFLYFGRSIAGKNTTVVEATKKEE